MLLSPGGILSYGRIVTSFPELSKKFFAQHENGAPPCAHERPSLARHATARPHARKLGAGHARLMATHRPVLCPSATPRRWPPHRSRCARMRTRARRTFCARLCAAPRARALLFGTLPPRAHPVPPAHPRPPPRPQASRPESRSSPGQWKRRAASVRRAAAPRRAHSQPWLHAARTRSPGPPTNLSSGCVPAQASPMASWTSWRPAPPCARQAWRRWQCS